MANADYLIREHEYIIGISGVTAFVDLDFANTQFAFKSHFCNLICPSVAVPLDSYDPDLTKTCA